MESPRVLVDVGCGEGALIEHIACKVGSLPGGGIRDIRSREGAKLTMPCYRLAGPGRQAGGRGGGQRLEVHLGNRRLWRRTAEGLVHAELVSPRSLRCWASHFQ